MSYFPRGDVGRCLEKEKSLNLPWMERTRELEDVTVLVSLVNEISQVCMRENLWPEGLHEL